MVEAVSFAAALCAACLTSGACTYVSIAHGPRVERNDFDSKYAFTVVQNLMALAAADTSSKALLVTIPAS
ncbi:hypothetical protein [Paraburkholderia sp. DGU8]|uniref:hypothetical protein n=1 Tax=Paraburkholderia sp. DGU8 TaxID=3161997 RepID=UPI003467367F